MKDKDTAQPLWMTIARGIRTAIERGELRPGDRLASETELAAQWNVSAVTAHKAMQDLQREGWVVRKRRAGTVVAERPAQPPRRIALVFTDLTQMPQGGYARGVRDALPRTVKFLPYDTHRDAEREAAYLQQIQDHNEADGVICYATCVPENTPLFLPLARKIPLVFVDRIPTDLNVEGSGVDVVMTDNSESIRAGLELLQSRGHQRIAYFMEDAAPLISSVHERLAGYQQFIRESSGGDKEGWVRALPRAVPIATYFGLVEEYLVELMQGPEPITAVCCQQDKLLAAVLEACVHLKITVPDELEVLSFSDLDPFVQPLGRSAHRLVQRCVEMGGLAAKQLMSRLDNPELPSQTIRLQADLHPATVERTSTLPRYQTTAEYIAG